MAERIRVTRKKEVAVGADIFAMRLTLVGVLGCAGGREMDVGVVLAALGTRNGFEDLAGVPGDFGKDPDYVV
jgi:hypothetical protein